MAAPIRRSWCFLFAWTLVFGLIAGISGAQTAQALPQTCRLEVVLDGAIWPASDPARKAPMRVKLERDAGNWERLAMADSRKLHQGDHWGALTSVDLGEKGGSFAVALRVESDPWASTSGYAQYAVTLERASDGAFTGTWEGSFNGVAAKGVASGVAFGLVTSPRQAERPRLLLRKDQLPALRAKAQTAWGKQWLERVENAIRKEPEPSGRAIGHGLMYQLTGDKSRADAARQLLEGDVANWNNVRYVHGAAARVVLGSLAFDLVADACDPAFRGRMREVFRRKCDYLYYPPVGGFNPNDASNWSVMYRSALGLAALSCMAERGSGAEVPVNADIVAPKPSEDDGSPAVPLEADKSVGGWQYSGPVDVPFGVDATTIDRGKQVFAPLEARHYMTNIQVEKYKNPKLLGGVDFASVTGRRYLTANYLKTTLSVAKAGVYAIEFSDGRMEQIVVTLAGHRLANGDAVSLQPGRYPLQVLASIGVVGNWELVDWYLRFSELDGDKTAAWQADRRRATEHAATMRQVLGKDADIETMRWLGIARQRVSNWAQRALGENGWNLEGEAYTQHSLRCVLPFEQAHRNAMGRSVFTDERVGRLFALSTAKTVFSNDRVTMPSYGPGGGPIGMDNWGRGLGLIPPEQKQAGLWAMNRTLNLADKGKFKMPYVLAESMDTLAVADMFICGSPDDREANPADTLPRVLVDRKKGGYTFRNRWQDGDDFVVTYFLDSDPDSGGWRAPDWNDFRISGLGSDFVARGIAWGNGASARTMPNPRLYGNVVNVPEGWLRGDKGAAATFFDAAADGSGSVTANLDDIYRGPGADKKTVADLGIRATRGLAVDYSAKSGAPCLVVVADRIAGSKGENTWQLCTMSEHDVTLDDHGFTIKAAGGASLVGRVISPAEPKIAVNPVTIKHEVNYHGKHSQAMMKRKVISIPGGDSFTVVMTVQKGDTPQVKSDGATITVGERKIVIEGDKVLLK